MTAARTGKPEAVRVLLAKGAKVNAVGPRNQTALMWAAAEGNLEVVKLLIDAGADLRATLDSGFSPLLFAARNGRHEVVHALLRAGIDVNVDGRTEVGPPYRKGRRRFLWRSGMDILHSQRRSSKPAPIPMTCEPVSALCICFPGFASPTVAMGRTTCHRRMDLERSAACKWRRYSSSHGADVNARLERGKSHWPGATPFYLAAWTADVPLMRTLVELGADPMIPAKDNSTALMAATGIGRKMEDLSAGTEPEILAAAEYLLELGVDINAVNKSGETAMHGAAYKNLPKVVEFLDQQSADVKIWHKRNRRGSTPYLIAAGYRPGNFKPSLETMAAIKEALARHGVEPTEEPPQRIDPYAKQSDEGDSTRSVKLFNGWNLEGWSIQNGGRFSVEDGILKLDGGTGWLRSDKTFADFKLVIEFRFLEAKANSGIFVRTGSTSKKDKNGWPDNGYQVQCMDTLTGKPLATMLPYGAPPFDHKSDLAALKEAYQPAGEWQTFEITAQGETLEVKLNGVLVTTASNIKNREGHIGIQGEHGHLEFRKIELHP